MTGEGADASAPVLRPDGSSLAFLRKVDGTTRFSSFLSAAVSPRGGPQEISQRVTSSSQPDGSDDSVPAERPRTDDEKAALSATAGARSLGARLRRPDYGPSRGGASRRALAGVDHVVGSGGPRGKRFAARASRLRPIPRQASNRPWVAITRRAVRAPPRQVSSEPPTSVRARVVSPDACGSCVGAWVRQARLSLPQHLVVVETTVPAAERRGGLDPTLAGFVWKADSKTLVAHVQSGHRSRLVELAFEGRARRPCHRTWSRDRQPRVIGRGSLRTDPVDASSSPPRPSWHPRTPRHTTWRPESCWCSPI